MSITSSIAWLTKQVNHLLDQGCGCTDCSSSGLITPNLKFNWGKANIAQTTTDYYRTVNIIGTTVNATMNVYNLEVEISNFEDIEDYNPILLIDRYKARAKKDSQGDYRKAGYKHETGITSRINEVPLLSSKEIINFNQEDYFRWNESLEIFSGFGMGKRYNSPANATSLNTTGVECYVHLGFRLRLTIDGKDIETNHLGYLRMELNKVSESPKEVTLTYRYA